MKKSILVLFSLLAFVISGTSQVENKKGKKATKTEIKKEEVKKDCSSCRDIKTCKDKKDTKK